MWNVFGTGIAEELQRDVDVLGRCPPYPFSQPRIQSSAEFSHGVTDDIGQRNSDEQAPCFLGGICHWLTVVCCFGLGEARFSGVVNLLRPG